MKSNLLRIMYNRRSQFTILLLLILSMADLKMHLVADEIMFIEMGVKYHPAFASFLSGTTEGHIWQKLMFWFLPIYLLLICCDQYIMDVKTGNNQILIGKMGKARYIRNILTESFVFPVFIMFVMLMLNFAITQWFYLGGTEFRGMQYHDDPWIQLTYARPNLTYLIFAISASLLTGLGGLLSACCCLVFPDYKYAYPLAFIIWFYGVSADYSTTFLQQPFAEFGFEWLIPTWIVCIAFTLVVSTSTYIYKVKTDEI